MAAIASPTAASYRTATRAEIAAGLRPRTNTFPPWVALVGGALVLMFALAVRAYVLRPQPSPPERCPPTCPRPPLSPPLAPPHRYTSKTYRFSLDYGATAPKFSDDKSIAWALGMKTSSFIAPVTFAGEPQKGRSPQQIVDQLQQSQYPDAKLAYTIPGAEMGYNASAYGNVYDVNVAPGAGQAVHGRLIIIAAVKNDLAVEMVAVGPYVRSTRKDGHPNPANTPLAGWPDQILNTILWPGDDPL